MKLRSLKEKYVFCRSDMYYGVASRNDAVFALKQIISKIRSSELLERINKLPFVRDPRISLYNLVQWIKDTWPEFYFRMEDQKVFMGYTETGVSETMYCCPLDFLPVLRGQVPQLEGLVLKILIKFADYHEIADPSWEGRMQSNEFLIEGLESNLADEQNRDEKQKKYARQALDGWKIFEKCYRARIDNIRKDPALYIEDIVKELKLIKIHPNFQSLVDLMLEFVDLMKGKRIKDYSDQALETYYEINNIEKTSDGYWDFYDGTPVLLEECFLFCWGGSMKEKGEYDFEPSEILYAMNDYHGNFGTCVYSTDRELSEETTLDDFIEKYDIEKAFFCRLTSAFEKLYKLRDDIYFKKLSIQYELFGEIPSFLGDSCLQASAQP